MSGLAAFNQWQNGCVTTGHYGVTSGDSVHQGLLYYREPFPCPNGHEHRNMPHDQIREMPRYKARLAKARADISEHSHEHRIRAIAALFTREDLLKDIEDIRTWANSFKEQ